MKATSFQTVNNLTGLRSITFLPAQQGNMLCRLERLRQLAIDNLAEAPNNSQSSTENTKNQASC